jgi:hypothetical protein
MRTELKYGRWVLLPGHTGKFCLRFGNAEIAFSQMLKELLLPTFISLSYVDSAHNIFLDFLCKEDLRDLFFLMLRDGEKAGKANDSIRDSDFFFCSIRQVLVYLYFGTLLVKACQVRMRAVR